MAAIDEGTEREIRALEEGLQNALMSGDLRWFEQNWTDDSYYVHMSGGVDDRASFIERLRSKATVYRSRQTRDIQFRRYGDTVVAFGASLIDILVNGEPRNLDTRFTRVYVKLNGHWKLAANQSGANTAKK